MKKYIVDVECKDLEPFLWVEKIGNVLLKVEQIFYSRLYLFFAAKV